MKLLVIHLSDVHIKDKNNYNNSNVKSIVNALRTSTNGVKNALIIVSGDVLLASG